MDARRGTVVTQREEDRTNKHLQVLGNVKQAVTAENQLEMLALKNTVSR